DYYCYSTVGSGIQGLF
nr:immunoglobulin light chain junction region [Macaca mulatta]